ncbi:MAG TPA: right-handed parallel beta-helix repeat-containing protein [Mycobacterium sp.]
MSTATEWRYLQGTQWLRRGYPAIDPGPATPVGAISATALQALLTAGSAGQIFQLAANTVYSGFEALNQATGLVLKPGQKLIGAPDGSTILDGSTVITGWTLHAAGVWKKTGSLPAPYLGTWNGTTFSNDAGQSEIPYGDTTRPDLAGACYPREQMWCDGIHLTRVMRLQDLTSSVVSGGDVSLRFYQDFTANVIYINVDPAGHELRMSTARYLIQAADPAYTADLSNCGLANLTVRRFASKSQLGAVTISGPGWEIANCTFTGNHAIGLHLADADNAWIHGNRFHLNGQLGMGHNSSDNTIVEDNEFYANNTDSYWAADWESGGYKCTYSANNTFRRNKVWNNVGVGAWWDIDNRDALVELNDIWDNQADGVRFEISYGAQIRNNWITGNGLYFPYGLRVPTSPYSMLAVAGVNVNSSPNVKVYGNMLSPDPTRFVATSLAPAAAVHTRGNQNGIGGQMRARGDGGFGPRDLNNFEVYGNDVTLTGYFLADVAAQGKTPTSTGTEFGATVNGIRTLSVDTSLYYSAAKNNRFHDNTYRLDTTTKARFAWNQTYMSFAKLTDPTSPPTPDNPQEVGSTVTTAPRPGLRVAAGGDDGTWTSVGTTAFTGSTTSNLIGDYDATNYGHCAWIRLSGVQIPRGATIDSAYLEVLARGQNGGTPAMLVRAHNAGNSTAPANRADVDARPRTSAQTAWAPGSWPVGTWLMTPSIAAVLQEIVNRPDWAPGNAITLFLEPQVLGFSVQQLVSFTAYDDPSRSAAGLIVTYH